MNIFDQRYAQDSNYYPAPTKMLCDYIEKNLQTDATALDLGCGNGRNTIWLLQHGYTVSAIDVSASGIESLESQAESLQLSNRLTTRVESALETSALNNEYDLIVASTLLCHLTPADSHLLMFRIKAALKPNGIAYASVFTVDDPSSNLAAGARSETADAVINPYGRNQLLRDVAPLFVSQYSETREIDRSHGPEHIHAIARIIARKVP